MDHDLTSTRQTFRGNVPINKQTEAHPYQDECDVSSAESDHFQSDHDKAVGSFFIETESDEEYESDDYIPENSEDECEDSEDEHEANIIDEEEFDGITHESECGSKYKSVKNDKHIVDLQEEITAVLFFPAYRTGSLA